MFRLGLFAALCCVVVFSAPREKRMNIADTITAAFPAESRLLPPALLSALKSLTPQDLAILREMWQDTHNIQNEQAAINFLRSKSPALLAKVQTMQQMLRAKIAALGPEAKGFVMKVKQSVGILRILSEGGMPSGAALASHVNQVRAAYRSLSPAAQADLKKQFPFVTAVIQKMMHP
ncbi:hypothetical protein Q1695_016078 [Nippostrongylus brasiliensis]|nr:hypothetical protein Q1695_016078 [Nippostrongylus brasiliensis]